jgi:magnesium chelatase subunit D
VLAVAARVVECEIGRFGMGLAETLAARLRGEYVELGEVSADALTTAVRGVLPRPSEGAA